MNIMRKLFLLLAVVMVVVGCAGAPDPEPEPAPEPTPEPEVVEEPEEPATPFDPDLAAAARDSATELRTIVERNNFGPEAPEDYAAAEEAFSAAADVYDSDPERSRDLYEDAARGYRTVIDEGARARADRARAAAHEERERARSVRAEVAQRSRYNQAQEDLDQAESLLEQEEYEGAFASFDDARDGFRAAYIAARDQRERALRSLEQLDSDLIDTAGRLERMQDDMEVDNE